MRDKITVLIAKLQFKAGSVKMPTVFLDRDGMVVFLLTKLFEFALTDKTLFVCQKSINKLQSADFKTYSVTNQ
jgi:hypothetical protein